MSLLWGMMNSFQLLTHMPLIQLTLPPNALSFYQLIIDISSFNIIPLDDINNYIFHFNDFEEEPFNDNFDLVGYPNTNLIQNLGPMFYLFFFICFQVIFGKALDLVDFKYER